MSSIDEVLIKLSAVARYEIRHAQLYPGDVSNSDLPAYLKAIVSFDPHSDIQIEPSDGAKTHAIFRITPASGWQKIELLPERAALVLASLWRDELLNLKVRHEAQYAEVVRIIEREYPRAAEELGIASINIAQAAVDARSYHPASSTSSGSGPWGCVAISTLLVIVVVGVLLANTVFGSAPRGSLGSTTEATDTPVPTATVDWTSSPAQGSVDAQNTTRFTLPVRGIADALETKCSTYEGQPFGINGTWEEVVLANATNHSLSEHLTQEWFLSVGLCPTNVYIYQAPGAALDNWRAVEARDKSSIGALCSGGSRCTVTVVVYKVNGSGNFSRVTQTSFSAP